MKNEQVLKLNGKTAVFIDWANVYKRRRTRIIQNTSLSPYFELSSRGVYIVIKLYNWKKSLKKEPNSKQIFEYLKKYKNIKSVNFYYGLDSHPKSKNFLKKIEKIGYNLSTKPVKYIKIEGTEIQQRKCDFDIEICMSVYDCLEKDFDSFLFFSGDGDFAPLYEYLIEKNKQVIVVFEQGYLGREIWDIKKGVFKTRLSYLIK